MLEQEMWERGVDRIEDGEVFTYDGRPVHFRALLKRRWGWPKKAAYRAADFIIEAAEQQGRRPSIWVEKEQQTKQQLALLDAMPNLLEDLLHGLGRSSQREVFDASHELKSLMVSFADTISDDGFTNGVLHALAVRFGTTVVELREHSVRFNTTTDHVSFHVEPDRYDP